MRKMVVMMLFCLCLPKRVRHAQHELTRGVAGATPIAVMPFSMDGSPSQDVSQIISQDLQNSGRFKVSTSNNGVIVSSPGERSRLRRYQVSFQLQDVYRDKSAALSSPTLQQQFCGFDNDLRKVAHRY